MTESEKQEWMRLDRIHDRATDEAWILITDEASPAEIARAQSDASSSYVALKTFEQRLLVEAIVARLACK